MARSRPFLLFLFTLLLVLPGIGAMPPLDRDESRFVQASKQMAETGDYVDIRFQEAARYKKPIGVYWLQSAALAISGKGAAAPIWVYRLISALAIALAVLSLHRTGARLFGPDAGFAAAIVLAGLFAVAFEGRTAKTDAVLLLTAILAQGALAELYVAARRGETPARYLPWLFWAAQAGAILVKGPIVPLLSLVTVAALAVFDREARWLRSLRPLPGVALAVVLVAPWLAMITWKSGGAFWAEAVGQDLAGKIAGGQESHGAPPGYFALTYSLFFWPFGLVAVSAGLRAIDRFGADPRLRFCLAWYIPFWLLLELVPTKLPHYVLPAYPALALLAGWALTLGPDAPLTRLHGWRRALERLTAFGLVVVTLSLAAATVGLPIWLEGRFSPWSVPAALLIAAAGWLAWTVWERPGLGRLAAASAAAGAAYSILFTALVPSLTSLWLSPRIAALVHDVRPCENSVLASTRFHEPSLVFLLGTPTRLTGLDGAARHLAGDPGCALALVETGKDRDFAARSAESGVRIVELGRVEGLNYSSGDRQSLTLYRAAP